MSGLSHATAFDDEQRMPLGLAERARLICLVQLLFGDGASQFRGCRLVQGAERDGGEPIVALEAGDHAREGRVVLFFLGTHGANKQAARIAGGAQKILEPLDGVAVGPLQVVDEEQQGSRRSKRLSDRVEEPHALPAFEL